MDDKKTMVSPQKKGTSKNKKKGIIAIVLVLALVIGGTLAYLGTRTDPVVNTFTGSQDIDLRLVEPAFNTVRFNGKTENDFAQDYTPGGKYLKNPMLFNSTKNADSTYGEVYEWVAMKVSFEIGGTADKTWGEFSKLAKIQFEEKDSSPAQYVDFLNKTTSNTDDYNEVQNKLKAKGWVLLCTSSDVGTGLDPDTTLTSDGLDDTDTWAIFIYQKAIKRETNDEVISKEDSGQYEVKFNNDEQKKLTFGSYTTPLFDRVKINDQYELVKNNFVKEDSTDIRDVELPEFKITLAGAGVKNETISGNAFVTDLSDASDDKAEIEKDLLRLLGVTYQ